MDDEKKKALQNMRDRQMKENGKIQQGALYRGKIDKAVFVVAKFVSHDRAGEALVTWSPHETGSVYLTTPLDEFLKNYERLKVS